MTTRFVQLALSAAILCGGVAHAQFGRGGSDWMTAGGDAQRSSWVRSDAKIGAESVAKGGFQQIWKTKLNHDAKQPNSLTNAVLMDRYIGYRGFRSYAFAGGSANQVFALDSDLSRIEWQKKLTSAAPANPAPACGGGSLVSIARPTSSAFPGAGPAARGGGRGGPAKSAVGAPNEGAALLAELAARPPDQGFGGPPRPAGGPPRAREPVVFYALSTDGALHAMYVSNGEEPKPGVAFVPANSNPQGFIVTDGVAYAATTQGCGGAPEAVWALDVARGTVSQWKAPGTIAGSVGFALGPKSAVYVAAGSDLVALEAGTLAESGRYAAGSALASSPVVFEVKGKVMIAVAAKDGQVHVVDSSMKRVAAALAPGAAALSSWVDAAGSRWVLAAGKSAVTAMKLNGSSLEAGWTSREMSSSIAPMIVNGVVFAVAAGSRGTNAVVYALDGLTGKELWNSGKSVASVVTSGGLSAVGGQVYLGTQDGTMYAFGFPMEH